MSAPEKTTTASSQKLAETEREDWLDREIVALRQSVEGESSGRNAQVHAESRAWEVNANRPLEMTLRPRVESLPLRRRRSLPVAARARRLVRRRRVDFVLYAVGIAVSIALALLVVSIGPR
jgi:hypothetical protein